MLFKELVPAAVMSILLAPFCEGQVLASALDNAGAAFVLNALSCACPMSLALLRPLADSLARHHLGLVAGHAHREHNQHTDDLSHALTDSLWRDVVLQAKVRKSNRIELHFVVHDTVNGECFQGTMSFVHHTSPVANVAPP